MRKAEYWLTRLIDKFETAQSLGVVTAVLNDARSKHAEAHIHYEWWSATHGAHFHNPQQFEVSVNKGERYAQAVAAFGLALAGRSKAASDACWHCRSGLSHEATLKRALARATAACGRSASTGWSARPGAACGSRCR